MPPVALVVGGITLEQALTGAAVVGTGAAVVGSGVVVGNALSQQHGSPPATTPGQQQQNAQDGAKSGLSPVPPDDGCGGCKTGQKKKVNVDKRQLQSKFKHASDFGVDGNYTSQNADSFEQAIQQHVNDPNTTEISGTYRGNPANFYLNTSNGLNVITDANGNFVSGWRLSADQMGNILTRGSLGGG